MMGPCSYPVLMWLSMGVVALSLPFLWRFRENHGPTYPEMSVSALTWISRLVALIGLGVTFWVDEGERQVAQLEVQLLLGGAIGVLLLAPCLARLAIGGAALTVDEQTRKAYFHLSGAVGTIHMVMALVLVWACFLDR